MISIIHNGIEFWPTGKTGTRITDGVRGIEYRAFSHGRELRLWAYEDGTFYQD